MNMDLLEVLTPLCIYQYLTSIVGLRGNRPSKIGRRPAYLTSPVAVSVIFVPTASDTY